MSTNRRIELACIVAIVLALVGVVAAYAVRRSIDDAGGHAMAYEQTLFDTSKVHTIDIVMDDWDTFIENCENEEYASCAVVVDGESFKNVAIRAKGNTSLSNVSQLDSDRYSFKVEFDHYNSDSTYHGLDKLSLNNIIQDNTYMKDYLTYRMMGEFGVDSPLASYAFITVNGEDWGLYLAVESVEDSFLERVYGTETGDLYKPDSTDMGGGRGNGREFNMDDALEHADASEDGGAGDAAAQQSSNNAGGSGPANGFPGDELADGFTGGGPADGGPGGGGPGGGPGGGGPGGGMGSSDVKLQYTDDDPESYSSIFGNAKTTVTAADKARLIESLRKLNAGEDLENVLNMDEVLRYFVVHDYVCNADSYTGQMIHNYYLRENNGELSMIPWDYNLAFGGFTSGDATSLVNEPIDDPVSSGGMAGGMGAPNRGAQNDDGSAGNTSSNRAPSTSNQTHNAKSPNGMQMPQPSEEDGNAVAPVANSTENSTEGSSADSSADDSRPMVDWIFTSDEYKAQYHELYQEFINSIDVQALIENTDAMIASYVERDPTKFCTTEEYVTAVATLKQFCALRSQSVQGQLDGTIPSTEEGQQEDSSALVDASTITISDMGSMGNNGGGPGGGPAGSSDGAGREGEAADATSDSTSGGTSENGGAPGGSAPGDGNVPGGGATVGGAPGDGNVPGGDSASGESTSGDGMPAGGNASGMQPAAGGAPRAVGMSGAQSLVITSATLGEMVPILVGCAVLLAFGFGMTRLYRRP